MSTTRRFPADVVNAVRAAQVVGVRAGDGPHRIVAVWAVVVEGRVFVRSWSLKERSWHRTFRVEPRGVLAVDGREMPVRAVVTRSERLKAAVDAAYAAKYRTPASLAYVRDLCRPESRDTTTELVPMDAAEGAPSAG